jgi:hypothetical protein
LNWISSLLRYLYPLPFPFLSCMYIHIRIMHSKKYLCRHTYILKVFSVLLEWNSSFLMKTTSLLSAASRTGIVRHNLSMATYCSWYIVRKDGHNREFKDHGSDNDEASAAISSTQILLTIAKANLKCKQSS